MTKIVSGIGSLSQYQTYALNSTPRLSYLLQAKRPTLKVAPKALLKPRCGTISSCGLAISMLTKIEDAERGVALAIEAAVDLIVAVGGGSVMDMAKLIKAFYTAPEKSKELAMGALKMNDPKFQ